MKLLIKYSVNAALVFLLLNLAACSSGSLMDDPEYYRQQAVEWEQKLKEDPNDFETRKNLCIYYVQTKDTEQAGRHLTKAIQQQPGDPAINFYYGLNLELLNKPEESLEYYRKYNSYPEDNPFRDMMEGRLLWLNKNQAYTETKSLFEQEANLSVLDVSDSTIAVFPLIYQGIDTTFVPLSRGFSEMVSIDLAKVKQFRVLERIRIQAVLDEIKFSQSTLVDQSTAPRAGKILKAGTIVSGDYDVTKNGYFRINLGSWDSQTSMRKSWVNKSGTLDDFFRLQKEVVFAFLKANGIELTKTEMEAISFIPTQNLQAFLLYSRGLLQEDAGNFRQAETFFNDAISIDPQFNAAQSKMQMNQKLSSSGGTKEQVVTTLQGSEPTVQSESNQLVTNRASNLGNNITSNFIQGVDNRNAAPEEPFVERGALPPPPPPPPGGAGLRGR
ncbi:MAG: hypothetical protein IPM56_01060 [Ignavibacteriales bacterium]|nr:MAG: hypothetical protein IPM56_01060 [Ignavibacteriales bacterium]